MLSSSSCEAMLVPETSTLLTCLELLGMAAFFWVVSGMITFGLRCVFCAVLDPTGGSLKQRILGLTYEDFLCPKRRARWAKCRHRCNRRKEKRQSEETGALDQDPRSESCVFQRFYKMHLPPPLPFCNRKKAKCGTKEAVTTTDQGLIRTESSLDSSIAKDALSRSEMSPARRAIETVTSLPLLLHTAPTPKLMNFARMQQWNAILRNVNRSDAKYRDSDGLYPLHWACSGGPPTDVIKALLESYPSAARKRDSEGSTALHFAGHYCASLTVLEALLKVYPKAIRIQDKYGRSPLYHAVDKTASLDVLKLLLKADPSMTLVPCVPHESRHLSITRDMAVRTPLFMVWAAVYVDQQQLEVKRGKKWEKALLLLEAAYIHHRNMKSPVPRGVQHLPAAIVLDIYLPEEAISMLVNTNPSAARWINDQGQYPLAVAAQTVSYSPARSEELLNLLLDVFAEAAKYMDRQGRSALWLALASGQRWSLTLERLWKAAPEALSIPDAQGWTTLFVAATAESNILPEISAPVSPLSNYDPYGLLGVKYRDLLRQGVSSKSSTESPTVHGDAADHLDTVFRLLQANPNVLTTRC